MSSEFGPLPRHDKNSVLEERGFVAFRSAIPADRFILRDERITDRGVDASLELVIDGCATNFRSQTQLKATRRAQVNADGSWSLQIELSNLNYLLNGPSPLLVLWSEDCNETRFVWVRDEAHRLGHSTEAQVGGKTTTIRFSNCLHESAWAEIQARVLREGRLQREIHNRLALTADKAELTVSITTPDLKTIDAKTALAHLIAGGMALISNGRLAIVDNLLRLLPPEIADDQKIQLVAAYSCFSRGDFISASSHCARAAIHGMQLSETDRHFLESIQCASDYHSGRITHDEFIAKQNDVVSRAPPEIGLQLRIDAARRKLLVERDQLRREQLLLELKSLIKELSEHPQSTVTMRVELKLIRTYAEGIDANTEFLRAAFSYKIQQLAGAGIDVPQVAPRIQQAMAAVRQSYADLDEVINEAIDQKHPLLYAEAVLTRAVLLSAKVSLALATNVRSGKSLPKLPEEMDTQVVKDLSTVIDVSVSTRSIEKELRASMILADWHELFGRTQAAQAIARDKLGMAKAMGYDNIAANFQDHLSGNTRLSSLMAAANDRSEPDDILLAATDQHLRSFAIDWLDSMGLPRDRLPIIEREASCMRDVAREKVAWCRHIRIEQILDHMQSRSTMYSRDPIRSCVCEKFGYRSRIEDSDWTTLIHAFKGVYCADCGDRSPK